MMTETGRRDHAAGEGATTISERGGKSSDAAEANTPQTAGHTNFASRLIRHN